MSLKKLARVMNALRTSGHETEASALGRIVRRASITFFISTDLEPEEVKKMSKEINDLYLELDKDLTREEEDKVWKKIGELESEMSRQWPEVNFSNDNARAVLDALGYTHKGAMGELKVAELLQKIMKMKNSRKEQKGLARHEREFSDSQEPGHARMLDFGLSRDEIMERILRLETVAKKAMELGVEEIHFG